MKKTLVLSITVVLTCLFSTSISLGDEVSDTNFFSSDTLPSDPVELLNFKAGVKQQEIRDLNLSIEAQQNFIKQLNLDKNQLVAIGQELIKKRDRAKTELDQQFALLLSDPTIDLNHYQKLYQDIWTQLSDNQIKQQLLNQSIEEAKSNIKMSNAQLGALRIEFNNLELQSNLARIKRIESELKKSLKVETNYIATCKLSMTLSECRNQAEYLTKQKAVSLFKTQLIDSLTEASLAKQHMSDAVLNVYVQESQLLDSGFLKNGDYTTSMRAQVQARPDVSASCQLLNMPTHFCLNPQSNQLAKTKKIQDMATPHNSASNNWVSLTIRSNQYNDAVEVNGINYGSTPVELVLPKGKHQITVNKAGYQTYTREIDLNNKATIWVKLTDQDIY